MSQTMPIDAVVATNSMDKKAYAGNLKGLFAHLLDILFVDTPSTTNYYTDDMSSHMQRDIGLHK